MDIKIYSGVLLHLFRLSHQFLFKPLDSCVLPGLIISGDGPFQWNAVGHQLLDFIIECGPELLDGGISGITGIK